MATPGKWRFGGSSMKSLHTLMVTTRAQFMAWSEDLAALELQNQTVEFRRCIAEIRRNLQHFRETINKLPTTAAFTDEEVENTSGNVSKLLAVVSEVIRLKTHVLRKLEKLRFLLKRL
jgi:prophage DNA circulation protein